MLTHLGRNDPPTESTLQTVQWWISCLSSTPALLLCTSSKWVAMAVSVSSTVSRGSSMDSLLYFLGRSCPCLALTGDSSFSVLPVFQLSSSLTTLLIKKVRKSHKLQIKIRIQWFANPFRPSWKQQDIQWLFKVIWFFWMTSFTHILMLTGALVTCGSTIIGGTGSTHKRLTSNSVQL